MAIQKQVDILQQGVDAWNAWRPKHPDEKIDLMGANLIEANLNGAYLNGAYLSGAYLNGADLNEAYLNEAYLNEAHLNEAHLNGARLSRANLSGAYLNGTYLSGAILSGAYLNEANLIKTDLSGAYLIEANLNGANLNGADLSGAHLNGAHLSGANLTNSIMGDTTLGELDLRAIIGLETVRHGGPSHLSINTLYKSEGSIPETFVRGTGAPNAFIEYMRALVSQPIQYYTCFISYSSKDELFARRLHNDLQQEGVRCWFAPEDMDVGDEIRHRIEETIKLYDKLLLILSESSIASTWVQYEVKRALNKEPQGIPNVLYPVRVDHAVLTCSEEWAHDIKSTRHIGNFENWPNPKQYEESFKRLLRALNAKKDQQKK